MIRKNISPQSKNEPMYTMRKNEIYDPQTVENEIELWESITIIIVLIYNENLIFFYKESYFVLSLLYWIR